VALRGACGRLSLARKVAGRGKEGPMRDLMATWTYAAMNISMRTTRYLTQIHKWMRGQGWKSATN